MAAETSTLIHGGTILTAAGQQRADLLIRGERIEAVGDVAVAADRVVDAGGCFVMPGAVDSHTHFAHLSANGHTRTADDFATGSRAALAGGTTSYVDFARAAPGEGVLDCFHRRRGEAARDSVADFALHPIVPQSAAHDDSFDQLARLATEEGATSWKFFMAYHGSMVEDDTLIRGFRLCYRLGVLPMVHAENGHIVADAIDTLVAQGRTAEHDHPLGHPEVAEREAIGRAADLARWCDGPVFVVHVSSAGGAEVIEHRRARGEAVLGETCPQYLVASLEDYQDLGFEAAAYVCSPPIREAAHHDGLWRAVRTGALGTVGTDHAAFRMDQPAGLPPQKPQGRGYFPRIPNGVPGVEERLMLLWHFGVGTGMLTPSQFVDRVATRPARVFGLHPAKGTLAPGSDADVVVWDPDAERTITSASALSAAGYSLYDGLTVRGVPRVVLARGRTVAEEGRVQADPGRGRYLPRLPFDRTSFL
ncbi:MAG TPA: dihydropyrimidinase [Cellulomonas sp.]